MDVTLIQIVGLKLKNIRIYIYDKIMLYVLYKKTLKCSRLNRIVGLKANNILSLRLNNMVGLNLNYIHCNFKIN